MKLKFTTKMYIAVNAVLLIFRTIQILFLTEAQTAFLKPNLLAINIIATIIITILLLYTAANSYLAIRQPTAIGNTGNVGFVLGIISAVLFLAGFISTLIYQPHIWSILAVSSLATSATSTLYAVSQKSTQPLPRVAPLSFIVLGVFAIVSAYMFYSEHPLRVRTVYEFFALVSAVLFFLSFGKAVSAVKPKQNFRLMYPLGIVSSTLCFASVVPELLASVFNATDKISSTCVSQFILFACGLFIATVTLSTHMRTNTKKID